MKKKEEKLIALLILNVTYSYMILLLQIKKKIFLLKNSTKLNIAHHQFFIQNCTLGKSNKIIYVNEFYSSTHCYCAKSEKIICSLSKKLFSKEA